MSFHLARLLRDTERSFTRACALVPLTIDPQLARAEGTLRGAPVVIETQAWRGSAGSPIAWARFATLEGAGIDVGNVVVLAHPRFPLPILGADLVALTPRAAMMAADLSPTLPPGPRRDAQLADLARTRVRHPALPPAGELPAFCARFFSPHHVYTRYAPEQREVAEAVLADLVRAYVSLVRTTPADDASVEIVTALQADYADAHVADDKGLELLARAFGRPWALRYVHEIMFPQSAPTGASHPAPPAPPSPSLATPKDAHAR